MSQHPSPDLVDDPRFTVMRDELKAALIRASESGLPPLCLLACLVGQMMLIVDTMTADRAQAALDAAISTFETYGPGSMDDEVPPGIVH